MTCPTGTWAVDRQQEWDQLATALAARGEFGPEVASGAEIASWVEFDLWAGHWHAPALLVMRGGVPFEDLVTAAYVRTPGGASAARTTLALLRSVRTLAGEFPAMTVRDALGWTLWAWSLEQGGLDEVVAMVRVWTQVWDDAWERAGQPARDGRGSAPSFVYAAAGLNPVETVDGLLAGTVDSSIAYVMAVLRGAPLPVGSEPV